MDQPVPGYGNRGKKASRKNCFVFSEFETKWLNVTQLNPHSYLSSVLSNKIKSPLRKPGGNKPIAAPGIPSYFLEDKYF